MASEPVECQVLVLRVSIHCEGCKKKVKKVLLHVDGVYRCDIDGRSNRVTVTTSRKLDANILVARLRKSGKQAEPWPEEPKQQQPAESQPDDPSKPNEPAGDNAEAGAAEPNNGQASLDQPKQSADETPTPPAQESKEATDANGGAGDETKQPAAAHRQPTSEAKGKAKQQQQQQQDHPQTKPIDAKVTVEFDDRGSGNGGGGGYAGHHHMPVTPQQPVHVMSYNVARPMASTAYYAAAPTPAPAPMPMPMARPGPSHSQGYIDEYAPPNYYSRGSSPYEPYYYPPQPSPYSHQHSAAADDYYYGAPAPPPPQRSAFSPPRDAYGDMFDDENANSCSVM